MLVGCCLLFVVGVWCLFGLVPCGVLRGCCLLYVVCCSSVVVYCICVCRLLVARCSLCVASCVGVCVFDDCALLAVLCFVGGCSLCVVCWLMFGMLVLCVV